MMRRRLLLSAGLSAPGWARDRPVRMIVPFPPGSGADGFARRLAERMQAPLGQPVLVENREGGAGATGSLEVARARPDGQTILFGTASTLSLYSLVVEQPAFEPLTDLAPVSLVGGSVIAFAAGPGVMTELGGVLAAARARPGTLRFGSPGGGTYLRLAMELLMRQAGGLVVSHVPFRGGGPAMAALRAGEVEVISDTLATALDDHRAGRIRILALASAGRSPLLPAVPTVAEALGLPGFEVTAWMAVMLPNGVPPRARDRLAYAINATLSDVHMRMQLQQLGYEIGALLSPAEMVPFMRAEQARWQPIVQATGATLR